MTARTRTIWLLLLAVFGAPLARALGARTQWIDVPYCSAAASSGQPAHPLRYLLLLVNPLAVGAAAHGATPPRAPQLLGPAPGVHVALPPPAWLAPVPRTLLAWARAPPPGAAPGARG